MKKKTIFLVALLSLVAITSIYVGSTYAKYVSTAAGNATTNVAKWDITVAGVAMTDTEATLTNALTCTLSASDVVVADKIAPGRSCYVDLTIDPTDTEVAIDYSVAIGTITGSVDNLKVGSVKYVTGATFTGTGADLTGTGPYTGSIALPGTANARTIMTVANAVTIRIAVDWAYETTAVATNDPVDTVDGMAGSEVTIPVTVTLTQKAAS